MTATLRMFHLSFFLIFCYENSILGNFFRTSVWQPKTCLIKLKREGQNSDRIHLDRSCQSAVTKDYEGSVHCNTNKDV